MAPVDRSVSQGIMSILDALDATALVPLADALVSAAHRLEQSETLIAAVETVAERLLAVGSADEIEEMRPSFDALRELHCRGDMSHCTALIVRLLRASSSVDLVPTAIGGPDDDALRRLPDGRRALFEPVDELVLIDWTRVLLKSERSAHVAWLVSSFVYRCCFVRELVKGWIQDSGADADAGERMLDGPLLALLETQTEPLDGDLAVKIASYLPLVVGRLVHPSTAVLAGSTLRMMLDRGVVAAAHVTLDSAIASCEPETFDRRVLDGLAALGDRLPLDAVVNRCLEWLVRRFAEDPVEIPRVADALPSLGASV